MPVLPRFDIQGQVALVTGAARGLGRAIALALAAAGADVALGLRDAGAGGGVAAEIEALGRRAGSQEFRLGLHDRGQVQLRDFEIELAGLDLREIQDVIDDRHQRLARISQDARVTSLFALQGRVQQKIGITQNPI